MSDEKWHERAKAGTALQDDPIEPRRFTASFEIIRVAAMMYVRFPLALRNLEGRLQERGIELGHDTVRHWWNRFGPTACLAFLANAVMGCSRRMSSSVRLNECAKAAGAGTSMRCS